MISMMMDAMEVMPLLLINSCMSQKSLTRLAQFIKVEDTITALTVLQSTFAKTACQEKAALFLMST